MNLASYESTATRELAALLNRLKNTVSQEISISQTSSKSDFRLRVAGRQRIDPESTQSGPSALCRNPSVSKIRR
jgi:IS30 family transposase